MTITTIQLITGLAELLRQGGLLALIAIMGGIIVHLYFSRDKLYDRLILAAEDNAKMATAMTERVVEALSKSTAVAERIERRKFGGLLPGTTYLLEPADRDDDEEECLDDEHDVATPTPSSPEE